jgi:hypothetical protein
VQIKFGCGLDSRIYGSPFQVESAIEKLKKYASPHSDQIMAELIEAA